MPGGTTNNRLPPIVTWPDDIDQILTGDLTTGLAYCTPAGGAVVTAVAPIGMRDREAGTVTFTTSLGFGKKLERIQRNPRIALAYHAREHGFAQGPDFVLVQGHATPLTKPDRALLEDVIGPHAERFMGPPKRGRLFWDRWLQEYYADRVPVTVRVERIVAWPDAEAAGSPRVFGTPVPESEPPPQEEPKNGAGPRLDAEKAARRIGGLPNQLLTFVGADGYPEVRPVQIGGGDAAGISVTSCATPSCRRPPRRAARAPLQRRPGRPRDPRAHGLDVGRRGPLAGAIRAAHRVRLPGPRQQDPAAARQRLPGEEGPPPGEASSRGLTGIKAPA